MNSSVAKEMSILISLYPAGYCTLKIFHYLFTYEDKLIKNLILGPIILAIVIGITLRPRSTVSNNDNSKDENL